MKDFLKEMLYMAFAPISMVLFVALVLLVYVGGAGAIFTLIDYFIGGKVHGVIQLIISIPSVLLYMAFITKLWEDCL